MVRTRSSGRPTPWTVHISPLVNGNQTSTLPHNSSKKTTHPTSSIAPLISDYDPTMAVNEISHLTAKVSHTQFHNIWVLYDTIVYMIYEKWFRDCFCAEFSHLSANVRHSQLITESMRLLFIGMKMLFYIWVVYMKSYKHSYQTCYFTQIIVYT